ncbi:protein of unknown function [Agrobacterium pusense]|uniref:Uncharacterized protein n=1 Tax=Agrobacterium pusense TaxID=648995 RepID=U4Q9W7_9HYPH|nr:protein of unknown function [Agrobacterium pusense]
MCGCWRSGERTRKPHVMEKTAPSTCHRRCSARLAWHVEDPGHQGFDSRIIGWDCLCIMHTPKKAGPVPAIRTGRLPRGMAPLKGEAPGRILRKS